MYFENGHKRIWVSRIEGAKMFLRLHSLGIRGTHKELNSVLVSKTIETTTEYAKQAVLDAENGFDVIQE